MNIESPHEIDPQKRCWDKDVCVASQINCACEVTTPAYGT